MPVSDIAFWPASELAGGLRRRAFGVRELVDMFIARIGKLDPLCRAFITTTEEDARRRADWCDRNRVDGLMASPFFGIPFATKDMIESFDSGRHEGLGHGTPFKLREIRAGG